MTPARAIVYAILIYVAVLSLVCSLLLWNIGTRS